MYSSKFIQNIYISKVYLEICDAQAWHSQKGAINDSEYPGIEWVFDYKNFEIGVIFSCNLKTISKVGP